MKQDIAKKKLLIVLLLLASLIGYMEWPIDNRMHIYELELDLLSMNYESSAFAHPFILLPLIGQVLLLIGLFQSSPSKILIYTGIGLLSSIMLTLLLIGFLQPNLKMIGFALPFVVLAIITIFYFKRRTSVFMP